MDTRSIMIEIMPEPADTAFSIRRFSRREFRPDLGVDIDPYFTPVPMSRGRPSAEFGRKADAFPEQPTVLLRADVDEEDIARLYEQPAVVALWSDPEIAPFAVDCDSAQPKGSSRDIADATGASKVWQLAQTQGDGINIGIVDGGVDGRKYRVAGGWSPDPRYQPGDSHVGWGEHGNMCAHDALIACPQASIFDYRVGMTRQPGIPALLSSVVQSYQHALDMLSQGRAYPQVMSNSWGLYEQSWDPYPPGHPMNYTHNPQHAAISKILEYIDAGNLVSFAAGNCGSACPDARCGSDVGPGKSIRGANGHERVISVGAVNLHDQWIGYSSQGPSTLSNEKPDICAYSHFSGYFSSDSGTSAACPVVAGILGLLRAARGRFGQDRARQVLIQSARKVGGASWRHDFGHGVVDAAAAYRMLP